MIQYLDALREIMAHGDDVPDRTGTGCRSIFGMQMKYDLRESFPAVTTKRLAWKAVVSELLWFIEGSGNERRLAEILHGTRDKSNRTIWTDNANADYWKGGKYDGDLGRVYGVQWRSWQYFLPLAQSEGTDDLVVGNIKTIDQLANLINGIKTDPHGRRHILTAWNPAELNQMALPPCHLMSQFNVNSRGELNCQMYQRSADMFLGVPFNIASYSLLTYLVARACGLKPGQFVHTIGDAHVYSNHFEQVEKQLERTPKALPNLILNPDVTSIDNWTMNDIKLSNYEPMSSIPAKMAV